MQKHLLVIEANTTGTGLLALQKAQSLGLSPIFLTAAPERYRDLNQVDCPVVVCSTNSVEAIVSTIASLVSIDQLLGITTTSEFYLEAVAVLTDMFHLPGNSTPAIKVCRNKAQTRLSLDAASIRQPRFAIVRSVFEINKAFKELKPPYVVKPVDGTGSHEVLLCQSKEEAVQHTQYILGQHTNVRGQHTAQTALIEEYLDAPEFSVEMFTWQGKTACIGITEKSLTGSPYFVEYRHIFPAHLSVHVEEEIQATVRGALDVLGVTHGASHTEVKLTPQGCAIIEVNARLAGGMIPELIRYTTGTDLLEQQLLLSVAKTPNLSTNTAGYAGIQFLIAHMTGILSKVKGVEDARKIHGIEKVAVTATSGTKVFLPRSAYERIGYVIARADTYREAVQRLNMAIANLELLIQCSMENAEV